MKPVEGRKCLLSASTMRLMRVVGLPSAMAELAAVPVGRSHLKLREACRAVAAAFPRPPGPVAVVAVREGRRTVGHRLADGASAVRVAHGVAAGRTMEAELTGPLAPKIAKKAGLRDARRRPWHKDPEKAAAFAAAADRFFEAYRPMTLAAGPGDPWMAALVVPRPLQRAAGADVVVVTDDEMREPRFVFLTREMCPLRPDLGREEKVRAGIAHALRNPATHQRPPARFWRPDDEGSTLRHVFAELDADEPEDFEFHRRLAFAFRRTVSSAMARFRRMLPQEISEHASLCGDGFADPRTAAEFLMMRRGWGLDGYRRMNQAFRLVPLLRGYVGVEAVTGPVLAGRPLEEAVRGILVRDGGAADRIGPLHPKTVRSLGGTWPSVMGGRSGAKHVHARLIRVVEAAFRRDPHLPVFRQAELVEILQIVDLATADEAGAVDAILAHRGADGRVRRVRDVRDAYEWIVHRIETILRGAATAEGNRALALAWAVRILFPRGRRHPALARAVMEWHELQPALDDGYRRLMRELLAAHLTGREAGETVLFPHFLTGEVVIDGVTMRPLVDEDDIVREGADLRHCVGSYAGRAGEGRSLLVSQASADGRSTVEVTLLRDESGIPALVVVQNRSEGNAEPPRSHVAAMARLLRAVPEASRRELERRIALASASTREEDVLALLTPAEAAALKQRALADLAAFLPGPLRRPTVAAWTAAMAAGGSDLRFPAPVVA